MKKTAMIRVNPAAKENLERGILYSSKYIEDDELILLLEGEIYLRQIDIVSEIDDGQYLYIVSPITH